VIVLDASLLIGYLDGDDPHHAAAEALMAAAVEDDLAANLLTLADVLVVPTGDGRPTPSGRPARPRPGQTCRSPASSVEQVESGPDFRPLHRGQLVAGHLDDRCRPEHGRAAAAGDGRDDARRLALLMALATI
jgi:hypothetical protein